MKIKQSTEDFKVREDCALAVEERGPHAIYLLVKRGMTTPEAVMALARLNGVPYEMFRYAGLKDRRSESEQVITVHSPRDLSGSWAGLELRLLGRSSRPVSPADIRGNRFEVVVRDLDDAGARLLEGSLENCRRRGFLNYFDDQRFGSIRDGGHDGGRDGGVFAGERIVRRDWEGALYGLLAAPGPRDPRPEKLHREVLRERWGDWTACAGAAGNRAEREVFGVLAADPRAFRHAVNVLPREQTATHLSAWQSQCWNEALRELVSGAGSAPGPGPEDGACGGTGIRILSLPGLAGPYVFPVEAGEGTRGVGRGEGGDGRGEGEGAEPPGRLPASLPTLGRGVDWTGRPEAEELYRRTLGRRGLRPEDFVLRRLPKVGLRSFERAVTVAPGGLASSGKGPDERHPGRTRLTLSFSLPAGSYATMLLKFLCVCAGGLELEEGR